MGNEITPTGVTKTVTTKSNLSVTNAYGALTKYEYNDSGGARSLVIEYNYWASIEDYVNKDIAPLFDKPIKLVLKGAELTGVLERNPDVYINWKKFTAAIDVLAITEKLIRTDTNDWVADEALLEGAVIYKSTE